MVGLMVSRPPSTIFSPLPLAPPSPLPLPLPLPLVPPPPLFLSHSRSMEGMTRVIYLI